MKVEVDIVTSDDIKIYYTGKFQDFTGRYIIIKFNISLTSEVMIMAVNETHKTLKCFLDVSYQYWHNFFPKPQTFFSHSAEISGE